MQYELKNLADTKKLARMIAQTITPNFVVALTGNLGSGKTTLVREILYAMGVGGRIKSPSFSYVEQYQLQQIDIYHFDLYRFNHMHEWLELGFDEYFTQAHICFIEWAEKADNLIAPDWKIILQSGSNGHKCQIVAYTDKGQNCLKSLPENSTELLTHE